MKGFTDKGIHPEGVISKKEFLEVLCPVSVICLACRMKAITGILLLRLSPLLRL